MPTVIPASFRGTFADLRPKLELGEDYLGGRLKVALHELRPVVIQTRVKKAESAYAKLQKGDHGGLLEIEDLVAARAVFLHPQQVALAVSTVRPIFEVVDEKNTTPVKPTDFTYSQPHMIVKLPPEYTRRHLDLAPLLFELQFTTYVQHALQESVHDVIYKGRKFSWREHRLDGRLRGLLEIVDDVLENLANVAGIGEEPSYDLFDKRNEILAGCSAIWSRDKLPEDLRRFTITVETLLRCAKVSVDELIGFATKHPGLVGALSLDTVDKVLGLLLLERFEAVVSGLKARRVFVPDELAVFVPDLARFPKGKKIDI